MEQLLYFEKDTEVMEEEFVEIVDRMGGEHRVPKKERFLDPLDGCCHILGTPCRYRNCDKCKHAKRSDNSLDRIMKFCE